MTSKAERIVCLLAVLTLAAVLSGACLAVCKWGVPLAAKFLAPVDPSESPHSR